MFGSNKSLLYSSSYKFCDKVWYDGYSSCSSTDLEYVRNLRNDDLNHNVEILSDRIGELNELLDKIFLLEEDCFDTIVDLKHDKTNLNDVIDFCDGIYSLNQKLIDYMKLVGENIGSVFGKKPMASLYRYGVGTANVNNVMLGINRRRALCKWN